LAVLPVLSDLIPAVSPATHVVSIAAGVTLGDLERVFDRHLPAVLDAVFEKPLAKTRPSHAIPSRGGRERGLHPRSGRPQAEDCRLTSSGPDQLTGFDARHPVAADGAPGCRRTGAVRLLGN